MNLWSQERLEADPLHQGREITSEEMTELAHVQLGPATELPLPHPCASSHSCDQTAT